MRGLGRPRAHGRAGARCAGAASTLLHRRHRSLCGGVHRQRLGLEAFAWRNWSLFGPLVREGQWWRVLTTVLVHANILHIVFNMMVVVNLGFAVERLLGTPRMAAVSWCRRWGPRPW